MIPLSQPDITEKERKAVLGVLKTPYLSLGPKMREFEEKLAKYIGVKYAVALNSGTAGLHLIIKALNIGNGSASAKATADKDEVITTPFSFIASANCILYEGARPVFVDIDSKTLCIDAKQIEKAITKKTKAILTVDVFGHPADWSKIQKIAKKHKLYLIEDSAEALGAMYKSEIRNPKSETNPKSPAPEPSARYGAGKIKNPKAIWKKCGTFGDAAVLSFYPNKQLTTGEGGAVITDNKKVAEICESMRNHGRGKMRGEWNWLSHIRLGYNYRLSDINCVLGIVQLSRMKEIFAKREKVANLYNQKLKDVPEIEIPYVASNVKMSWFVYVVRLKEGYSDKERNESLKKLRKSGIGCSNYFPCIHLQPFYKGLFGYKRGDFPVAEFVSDRTIALPFYNNLKEKEIDYIVETLKKSIK